MNDRRGGLYCKAELDEKLMMVCTGLLVAIDLCVPTQWRVLLTKSTPDLFSLRFFSRFAISWPMFSTKAHSSKRSLPSARSPGRLLAYCASSSIPANSMRLAKRLGFLNAAEFASFSLKCTPWLFNCRKCSILAVVDALGDPGGDGGIETLGMGGSVRLCTSRR